MSRLVFFLEKIVGVALSWLDMPASDEVKRFVPELRLGVGPGWFPGDRLLE